MKKILYLILFLPVVAFSQVRPDQSPIIDANNSLYFYTMVNGAVRRVAITSLDSLINVGTNRDTVYTVANIPDTSGVTPQQGDILVNAALDTIGFYDGNSWTIVPIAVDLTAYVARTELTDTSTAIRGDFPVITRDTAYQIAAVSDTSGITPNQGDVFILNTKDTLGVYDGGAWVLFYGGSTTLYTGNGTITGNRWVKNRGGYIYWDALNVSDVFSRDYSWFYMDTTYIEFVTQNTTDDRDSRFQLFKESVSASPNVGGGPMLQYNNAVGTQNLILDSLGLLLFTKSPVTYTYRFPQVTPSTTLNDTTIMAWRGTGAAAVPIGFLPYGGSDKNGIFSIVNEGDTVAVRNINLDSVFSILTGTHSLQVLGSTAASITNGVIRATNTGAGTAIYGRADGTGYGVIGSSASGIGVRGSTTSNVGVFGIATTGIGGQFLTGGNYAISGLSNYASTSTMEYVATFYRSSSGTVANGMGAGLRFSLEDSLDTNIEAGTHGFRWTNVGNRDTRWELNTINANTTNRRIMIDHDGELTLDGYTTNNFIGTGWGRLAVTAGGLIVVDTTSGGGGTMDDWTIAGDAGTPQVVSDAETATIAGGYGINTSAAATRTVTVTADTAQLATVSALADTAAAIRGSLNTHLVYVSTVGDDANSGLSISEAKLTISAAITVASGLISGGASGVKVHVLDGATYTENIVVPPNVVVWAPGATLVGTVAVASRGEATFDQIYATANNQNLVSMDAAGTGPGIITANIIDGRGLSGTLTGVKGVRNTGGGGKNLFAHIGLLYVGEDGVGVGDVSSGNAGHIHLFCKDLYLAGNNAIGVLGSAQGAGSTNIVGWIDHILEISTPTATTGIKMDAPDAILKIIASEIIADTAYSISSGDLHIVVPRISGERVGTPAFESSNQKSYLNLLRLNLAADLPTRLLGADSDGDVGETTIGAGLQIVAGELSADTAQLATVSALADTAASLRQVVQDSLANIPSGSGTTNTLAMWTSPETLGNSIVTQPSADVVEVTGTGGLKIPVGTTAQGPAGVNGIIRFNSTLNRYTGYNVSAYQPFVEGSFTSTQVAYSNSDGRISGSNNFTYDTSNRFKSGNSNNVFAGGSYGFIAGGQSNTVSGNGSFAAGSGNTVSNSYSAAIGVGNTVSGQWYGWVFGENNSLTNAFWNMIAGGTGNSIGANNEYNFMTGRNNTSASWQTSVIRHATISGYHARGEFTGGQHHASGRFSVNGDAQSVKLVMRGIAINDSTIISVNGDTTAIYCHNNAVWVFDVQMVAVCITSGGTVSADDVASYGFRFTIKKTNIGLAPVLLNVQAIGAAYEESSMVGGNYYVKPFSPTDKEFNIGYIPPSGANSNTRIRVVATVIGTKVTGT